jgi:hypothetical protein
MERYKKEFNEKVNLKETFKPNFKNVDDFIYFLRTRLIPDLKKSGKFETAQDFEEAIYWLISLA